MSDQPTRYDQAMLRTMNRDEARHWHASRGQRRVWTVAHIVLTAATPAVFPLAGSNNVLLIAVLVPPVLFWCVCTGVLNGSTRGLLELRARALDERQLAERGRVHTIAHRTQLGLLLCALAGLAVTAGPAGADVDPRVLVAVLLGLLLTHWLLPLWTAALRAPDEPDDDELEGAAG